MTPHCIMDGGIFISLSIMIYFAAYAVNFYFKKKIKNSLITIIFLNSLFMINTI